MNNIKLEELEFDEIGICAGDKLYVYESKKDYFIVTNKHEILKILGIQIFKKSNGEDFKSYLCNNDYFTQGDIRKIMKYGELELIDDYQIKYVIGSFDWAKKILLIE